MSSARFYLPFAILFYYAFISELHADVVFTAIGDAPYTKTDARDLPYKLNAIDNRSAFTIHLGDIKSGESQCDEKVYASVADILSKAKKPVFIVPGDNEWNQCTDPDLAWQYWVKYFMRFDQLWPHEFNISRQDSHPENFTFVHEKVLFIGINIVGKPVHDKVEWTQRLADDLKWTIDSLNEQSNHVTRAVIFGHASPSKKHNDYFNELVIQAGFFTKPILYLHGDGHQWVQRRPYKKAQNILLVQVSINRPVTVTVTKDNKSPFLFDQK